MKWFCVLATIALAPGCAGDPDEPTSNPESASERAARKCREFVEGLCSQYVRCHARTSGGEPFTEGVCDAALPDAVAACVDDSSDEIAETSDADFDACAGAIREEACELVCGRVPEDPATCLALDGYDPQTLVVVCDPG